MAANKWPGTPDGTFAKSAEFISMSPSEDEPTVEAPFK